MRASSAAKSAASSQFFLRHLGHLRLGNVFGHGLSLGQVLLQLEPVLTIGQKLLQARVLPRQLLRALGIVIEIRAREELFQLTEAAGKAVQMGH
jgi:hypothetical protein